jgi:hypothetical protein
MNYERARTLLATLVSGALADWPDLFVQWDNADTLDLSRVGSLALRVDYYWDDAAQTTLGAAPLHRTTGSVYFTLLAKEGQGVKEALRLADDLTQKTKFRNIEGLVTTLLSPGRRERRNGWLSQEFLLSFYFDSLD